MADSQVTLQGHPHNLQRIEFLCLRLPVCQDPLDGPAHHLFFVDTEDCSFRFISQAEEGPSRVVDFSTQSVSVKITDRSPAGHIGLVFELQGFRQRCALPDEDSSRIRSVWHLSSPQRRHPQIRTTAFQIIYFEIGSSMVVASEQYRTSYSRLLLLVGSSHCYAYNRLASGRQKAADSRAARVTMYVRFLHGGRLLSVFCVWQPDSIESAPTAACQPSTSTETCSLLSANALPTRQTHTIRTYQVLKLGMNQRMATLAAVAARNPLKDCR